MKNAPAGGAQKRPEKPNPGSHEISIPHEIRNQEQYDHILSVLKADLEKTPEIAGLIKSKRNDVDLVNKLRTCRLPAVGVVGQGIGSGHPQNWYTLLGRLAHFVYPTRYQASKWPIMASHLDLLLKEVMDNNDSSCSNFFQYSHSREDCVSVMEHRGDGRLTKHQPIDKVVALMGNQAAKVMQILIQTKHLTPKKAVNILVWGDKKENIKGHQIRIVAKLLDAPIEEVQKLLQ